MRFFFRLRRCFWLKRNVEIELEEMAIGLRYVAQATVEWEDD